MKTVTGSLKVDLAQFRAMEAFAMFASDLDAASRQQLDRGQRLMALLKQPAYSPYPLDEMTVALWIGTTGRLDKIPTEDVLRFEREFLDYLKRSHDGILASIRDTQKFEDDSELASAYDSFLEQFETSDGASVQAGTGDREEALEDEEQEQIVKQKTAYEMLRSLVGSEMCIRDRNWAKAAISRYCASSSLIEPETDFIALVLSLIHI